MPSLLEFNVPMEQSPKTSGKHEWFRSIQSLSCVWLFATPWTAACQASLSITNSKTLLKLMTIELETLSNHLILCCPLLLLSIFSCIRVFSSESAVCIWWPRCWVSASTSVLSKNIQGWLPLGLTGLTSGVFSSLRSHLSGVFSQESSPTPQVESISSLVLSLLFGLTLMSIHGYWKTIVLSTQTFVSKVMSLLFNMLSMLVIAFLPRSKCLLISWLQSLSTVILSPRK